MPSGNLSRQKSRKRRHRHPGFRVLPQPSESSRRELDLGQPCTRLSSEPLDPSTRSSGKPLIPVPRHQLENPEGIGEGDDSNVRRVHQRLGEMTSAEGLRESPVIAASYSHRTHVRIRSDSERQGGETHLGGRLPSQGGSGSLCPPEAALTASGLLGQTRLGGRPRLPFTPASASWPGYLPRSSTPLRLLRDAAPAVRVAGANRNAPATRKRPGAGVEVTAKLFDATGTLLARAPGAVATSTEGGDTMEQGPSVGRIGIPNEVGSPGSELAEPTVACGLSRTN